MLLRRLFVAAVCAVLVSGLVCDRALSASGDKQLVRVKGLVGYQAAPAAEFKPIFGRLDLPDDSYAVTKPNGEAVLRLADSSEIDIGANTSVQVGAFNAAASGNANTIALNNGALHFVIRHPQGGQANYKFVTATSQIAVRGTEGFLIAGSQGTQVVCVSCASGDVSVQVGNQSLSIVSNQTLTIAGSNPLTATTSVTTNATVNNPAVNQFNGNQNPFNPNPTAGGDPTGSFSGGAGGGGAGALGAVAGGTAAVGAAVVAASTNKGGDQPSPSPTSPPTSPPTTAPLPGALVVQVSYPGANASFPVPFNWPFSQQNATTNATVTCGPPSIITCTVAQALSGTTLNGAISGNLLAPGVFTVGATASGFTVPTTSFTVYGGVTSNPPSVSLTGVGQTQTVVVTQLPNGTSLSASSACTGGAAMTLSANSGTSPWTLGMTAVAAPSSSPPPTHACIVTVTGQGGTSASTTTIPVDITSTGIGVSNHLRRKQ